MHEEEFIRTYLKQHTRVSMWDDKFVIAFAKKFHVPIRYRGHWRCAPLTAVLSSMKKDNTIRSYRDEYRHIVYILDTPISTFRPLNRSLADL